MIGALLETSSLLIGTSRNFLLELKAPDSLLVFDVAASCFLSCSKLTFRLDLFSFFELLLDMPITVVGRGLISSATLQEALLSRKNFESSLN